MARTSSQACESGINKAKTALSKKAWTQKELAQQVGCSRHVVCNFFAGRGIEPEYFRKICQELELDFQEIVDTANSTALVAVSEEANTSIDTLAQGVANSTDSANVLEETNASIDTLVQEVREKIKPYILERCRMMRVLDMTQPIRLSDIYTEVNILEKMTGRRWSEIDELLQNSDSEEFDRFGLGRVTHKIVTGLQAVEQYSKLVVLGKLGAGKTTFLKHLAVQCIEGQFQSDATGLPLSRLHFPIFITLKDFAEAPNEPNIHEYIAQQLSAWGVTDSSVKAQQLLRQGKALILLDGLDEVRSKDTKRVIKEIRYFSEQFHNNQFVITCRIAANEYILERFTEVEVANFDSKQITTFVRNWFKVKGDLPKAECFVQELEQNKPLRELATNPLLLTLLCLVFAEKGYLPKRRSKLYQSGLDVLLQRWDVSRGIERDQVYKNLSLKLKKDLLSEIALNTFESQDYLFEQELIEEDIAHFLQKIHRDYLHPEDLEQDSKAVLKLIEAQHGLLIEQAKGIYSFSHLTFQEYFVARKIKQRPDQEKLVKYITEKKWREIFLLTTEMLTSPDNLLHLMKQQVDALLATDEDLLRFHSWVDEKSRSVKAPYGPAAIRAFYSNIVHDLDHDLIYKLVFDHDRDFSLARDLVYSLATNPNVDLKGDLNRAITFACILNLNSDCERAFAFTYDLNHNRDSDYYVFARVLDFDLALDLLLLRVLEITSHYVSDFNMTSHYVSDTDHTLQHNLQQLKDQLPTLESHSEEYKEWWQKNGQAWIKQLRTVVINYRNIGHDWRFSDCQKELLKQYYDANKLLVNCLNSDCYVSCEVRQEIEDTLLLPIRG